MKTNVLLFLFAVIICVLADFSSNAQALDESKVKILPSASPGMLKILYAAPVDQPVHITFFKGGEILEEDVVSDHTYVNGFLKKYNVREVMRNKFWVKVQSGPTSLTYGVSRTPNGKNFIATLEKSTTDNQLMAKKK
jgi:hypothetical protein